MAAISSLGLADVHLWVMVFGRGSAATVAGRLLLPGALDMMILWSIENLFFVSN